MAIARPGGDAGEEHPDADHRHDHPDLLGGQSDGQGDARPDREDGGKRHDPHSQWGVRKRRETTRAQRGHQ